MKNVASGSNHGTDGGRVTKIPAKPFTENRYRRYRFDRESIVLNAPDAFGVYGLFNALWIYIGETDNIRARLLEHLDGDDHDPCIAHHQPTGFAFELISSANRRRRQKQLVKDLLPICKADASALGPLLNQD
jgi:hypothetical protein